eukprot:gene51-6773_t
MLSPGALRAPGQSSRPRLGAGADGAGGEAELACDGSNAMPNNASEAGRGRADAGGAPGPGPAQKGTSGGHIREAGDIREA